MNLSYFFVVFCFALAPYLFQLLLTKSPPFFFKVQKQGFCFTFITEKWLFKKNRSNAFSKVLLKKIFLLRKDFIFFRKRQTKKFILSHQTGTFVSIRYKTYAYKWQELKTKTQYSAWLERRMCLKEFKKRFPGNFKSKQTHDKYNIQIN